MDAGIISTRYATALLKLVNSTGRGDAVYDQVVAILKDPDSMPATLEPDLQEFVALLAQNDRLEYARQMLTDFTRLYNASRSRRLAHLVTAVPAGETASKIKDLLESSLGGEVILTESVDADIIGGFVLTVDDRTLDASVASQLARIRRELLEKNKRIV